MRKKIGIVSQEPVLFKRSVYENILYGNLNADKNQVIKAAEKLSKMTAKYTLGELNPKLKYGQPYL